MKLEYRVFRSATKSWEILFNEVKTFAEQIGVDRIISISHSEDANEGVVVVWYRR